MYNFIEINNFNFNALSLSFVVTIIFSIFQAYVFFKQNNKIIKNKSGKSVSFIFFSYYGFSSLAVSVYGIHVHSLALLINGLAGIVALIVSFNLFRVKNISSIEKFFCFISFLTIPAMIFMKAKDFLYVMFGLIISLVLFFQILEVWRNKSLGLLYKGQISIGLLSSFFWLLYSFFAQIWSLGFIYALNITLWLYLLVLSFRYKRLYSNQLYLGNS